jgi:hypothetical protein
MLDNEISIIEYADDTIVMFEYDVESASRNLKKQDIYAQIFTCKIGAFSLDI